MDDFSSRSSLRDRILNDLRSTVKQIYHESVNNELSPENKNYLCLTLIKNIDESLRHGLKQLHLGYWRPIQKILHPQTLQLVEKLPGYDGSESNSLTKGRTWIALSLRDDSFISYIHCLPKEISLEKFYEDWSILRNNDACNRFMSILSGLDNAAFTFQVEYFNKPPSYCSFSSKIIDEKGTKPKNLNISSACTKLTASTSSLTSPVDSGVHIQDSSSDTEQLPDDKHIDIDYLNGNVPEKVVLRKRNKDTKRHVSFHEDIIYKSPEKCRKLKWDSENLRYSWSGEEIDFCESDFKPEIVSSPKVLDINERGVPEGEETPNNLEDIKQIKTQKSIIVKRFLQSITKQSKIKQLSKKYNHNSYQLITGKVDANLVNEINQEIKCEFDSQKKYSSKFEIQLKESVINEVLRMDDNVYKAYQLRDFLFIIATKNIYLINKNLEAKIINFGDVRKILVYADSHKFLLLESKLHTLVTGDEELTEELLGRLELAMRRNRSELPTFYKLDHEDMRFMKKSLVEKMAMGKYDRLTYCAPVRFERENDLLESATPSSKRGFLMYRDRRTKEGWVPGDFLLKGGVLYLLSDGISLPKLAINLATTCQSCSRSFSQDRPHTFQITLTDKEVEFQSESNHFYEDKSLKSKLMGTDTNKLLTGLKQKMNRLLALGTGTGNGCVVEFAAADEYDMSDWLEMIIQAFCGECCEDASKDDVVDATLLLTTDSLIIATEGFSPRHQVEVLSCAQLCDVASFKIGESNKDLFTVIEFSCMEASSTSGDWILYLSSRTELDKLRRALQRMWRCNTNFPLSHVNEDRLISRCRRTQARLSTGWTQLHQ